MHAWPGFNVLIDHYWVWDAQQIALYLVNPGENNLRPRQNGWHFANNIMKYIFLNDSDFTEICSHGSNWQQSIFGSDDGVVPKRQQAIIWNNDGLVWWPTYMRLSASMS